MKVYRLITGPDDSAFCHRVTEALSKGWDLHGSPSLSFNAKHGHAICAQAVVKDVDEAAYDPERALGDY